MLVISPEAVQPFIKARLPAVTIAGSAPKLRVEISGFSKTVTMDYAAEQTFLSLLHDGKFLYGKLFCRQKDKTDGSKIRISADGYLGSLWGIYTFCEKYLGIDEENIMLTLHAKQVSKAKVITKVNRQEFVTLANKLELDTIVSPRRTISDVIVRYARALQNSVGSNVEKLYKIMDGNAEALKFNVHAEFKYVNIPLKDIKFKENILIAGILRNRKALVPTGDDVILPGDKVIVIGTGHILYELADIIA